eukprot:m.109247 g.109247  ORF g.109247 m.109247 type:complete len:273 (+) comp21253_c0_seq4:76-894(+)
MVQLGGTACGVAAVMSVALLLPSTGSAASVYMSPLGRDAGECEDSTSACRTLQYAVSKASTGDNVRVMSGVYSGAGNFIDFTTSTLATNLTLIAHEVTNKPRAHVFDALGNYATMRVGAGTKVVGIGFTGVRRQTVATFGILWIAGAAEVRDCEFWDNDKAIGITGGKTTDVHIHSTVFSLPCEDATCTGGVGIDFLRTASYDAVVTATDLQFEGKGTGIKLSLGTMRITVGPTSNEHVPRSPLNRSLILLPLQTPFRENPWPLLDSNRAAN